VRTHSRSRGTHSVASPRTSDRKQSRSEPRNRNGSSSWIHTSREPRWRDLIPDLVERVLDRWQEWARSAGRASGGYGLYRATPRRVLGWIGGLDARGIQLPLIVGLAGPATPATLVKFALRCGVGNSMRAVRSQIGRFGRLLTDTGPDEVMRGLQSAPGAATAAIAGFHLYPFGGLR
jgi:methylenetetrahydrofolate reductase (NADPH)